MWCMHTAQQNGKRIAKALFGFQAFAAGALHLPWARERLSEASQLPPLPSLS